MLFDAPFFMKRPVFMKNAVILYLHIIIIYYVPINLPYEILARPIHNLRASDNDALILHREASVSNQP